ncbi:putative aldo-keto reductase 2 [Grifola frondosa]|uniref:Putative aldo-keto reductase 2 n=1 Tax=Grifola frondosa TaxID=5627 RepID=A0A1C7M4C6_GRIFR|nr:putative aldo-keto reductase 2 [Grifola frondosa]
MWLFADLHRPSPENLRRSVDKILAALRGTKKVDLFEPARIDSNVSVEDTVRTLAELVREGKFDHIGLSETRAETLRRGNAIHPISMVEIEVSPWSYEEETKKVIATASELGITVAAYSPLGRGFLTGSIKKSEDLAETDIRRNLTRFQNENIRHNTAIVDALTALAAQKGITPAQLCIAWVGALGATMLPLPGSSNAKRTLENLAGGSVVLTQADMDAVARVLAAHPTRVFTPHGVPDDLTATQPSSKPQVPYLSHSHPQNPPHVLHDGVHDRAIHPSHHPRTEESQGLDDRSTIHQLSSRLAQTRSHGAHESLERHAPLGGHLPERAAHSKPALRAPSEPIMFRIARARQMAKYEQRTLLATCTRPKAHSTNEHRRPAAQSACVHPPSFRPRSHGAHESLERHASLGGHLLARAAPSKQAIASNPALRRSRSCFASPRARQMARYEPHNMHASQNAQHKRTRKPSCPVRAHPRSFHPRAATQTTCRSCFVFRTSERALWPDIKNYLRTATPPGRPRPRSAAAVQSCSRPERAASPKTVSILTTIPSPRPGQLAEEEAHIGAPKHPSHTQGVELTPNST